MHDLPTLAASFLVLLLAAQSPAPSVVAKGRLLLTVEGEGSQVYHCPAAGAWVLDHPDAELLDATGKVVGHHDAGPMWHYQDGSAVGGEAIEKTPSPEADSVPWLVLRATTHEGNGLLSGVDQIRRTATLGGAAPSAGCDAAHAGATLRIPYSATYTFYGKP